MKKQIPAMGVALSLLAVWQFIAMGMDAAYILPSPIQIVQKIWECKKVLFTVHLPATAGITGIGLLISVALGLALAILMDSNAMIEQGLYPVIIASQTIPTTAIAPLFVLWFGYSIWSKVLVTVLITFFPVVIAVFDGFKATKREMEELLLTYGASKRDIFIRLKIPTALPAFFSAIKMAIPLSLIGAAIGEWLGAQQGLGYYSKRMMTQLDGAGVFAPVVILSLVAMVSVMCISFIENKVINWRREL
jgi:putative hydroxymethylpyrimidine transport system permease protein